jgi:pimeloyl-ACP methyl ester carboxylesterase
MRAMQWEQIEQADNFCIEALLLQADANSEGLAVMLRRSELTVDGVRSVVLQGGPASSEEAIVLVHGNPGFSRDWEDLLERVGEFSRCLAPDMPGFGQAHKPDEFDYSVAGYARHLGGLLTKLQVRRAHLVLHDFGGPRGLAWAIANPTALASLTLINTGAFPDYRWHYLARVWRMPVLGAIFMAVTTRRGFHILLKHGNPRGLPKSFIDGMFDCVDSGTKRAVLRLYRSTRSLTELAERFGEVFRGWNCPTLVIWGRADPYLPVRYAERQREYFSKAQVVILENSGHWPYADIPEGVAAILLPFLKSALSKVAIR